MRPTSAERRKLPAAWFIAEGHVGATCVIDGYLDRHYATSGEPSLGTSAVRSDRMHTIEHAHEVSAGATITFDDLIDTVLDHLDTRRWPATLSAD